MTHGTRSNTGTKIKKRVNPDNRAEPIIPTKPTCATMRAKRSEAGKKAAATRRANLARKATEANAEDRPGQMGDVPPVLEDEDAPVTTPGSFFLFLNI